MKIVYASTTQGPPSLEHYPRLPIKSRKPGMTLHPAYDIEVYWFFLAGGMVCLYMCEDTKGSQDI